ncbi:MAG: nitroreductase family deazaflavin-dependent oxidoreductase [Candidatus Binatia bacterium]
MGRSGVTASTSHMPIDLTPFARQSTVRLTTTGRKSGKPRTVTIWFVVVGPRHLYLQHVRGPATHWYKNLCQQPSVQLEFGQGRIAAHATPIDDRDEVRRVLSLFRRKYWFAWLFQLLGMTRQAVAAKAEVAGAGR